MKNSLIIVLAMTLITLANKRSQAQESKSKTEKKVNLTLGLGYFGAQLNHEGVAFENASFAPSVGLGLSYFTSLDYQLSDQFSLGIGFNGNYAGGEFIKDAEVNGGMVDGYLEAGAVANAHLVLNLSYAPLGEGVRPFAKLGVGYFKEQVELGDVPLELTNNMELEVFPDFKSTGIGVIPEVGMRYGSFILSGAYSLPFDRLTGETVHGDYISSGSISSQGLQINIAYRFLVF